MIDNASTVFDKSEPGVRKMPRKLFKINQNIKHKC